MGVGAGHAREIKRLSAITRRSRVGSFQDKMRRLVSTSCDKITLKLNNPQSPKGLQKKETSL